MSILSKIAAVPGALVRLLGQKKVYRWRETGYHTKAHEAVADVHRAGEFASAAQYAVYGSEKISVDTVWRFSGKLA